MCSISFLTFTPNCYANSETTQISALLECSASTVRPSKNKKFSSTVSLVYAKGTLTGERSTGKRPGKEVYYGTLDQNKVFKIAGRGTYYGKNNAWHSKFSGELNDKDFTVLKGSMTNFKHNGHRDCKLSFLLPPEKLSALLLAGNKTTETQKSLSAKQDLLKKEQKTAEQVQKLADASSDLSKKQKALEAAQQQARQEQGISAEKLAAKQKSLQAEQDRLKQEQKTAASVLNEKQKALQREQDKLKDEQGKTVDDVHWVQNLLNGIVLPTTEDPKSWMMRVAAVPVQQQQFCRIVDQFYSNLSQVYQTRNDIKKNRLFRERKIRMATLLPRGEFTNWVVQIKEVTQAPDGSAAVMLQPPCRAMLGSDACQKNGSKIRATIPADSSIYRELGNVNAGDFVVISGKILYAESVDEKAPLPTYAVYQPGSHCSAVEGSKNEDVFVTEINYLVQLQ